MFDKIQNPKTGRWVKTDSTLGKKFLVNIQNKLVDGGDV